MCHCFCFSRVFYKMGTYPISTGAFEPQQIGWLAHGELRNANVPFLGLLFLMSLLFLDSGRYFKLAPYFLYSYPRSPARFPPPPSVWLQSLRDPPTLAAAYLLLTKVFCSLFLFFNGKNLIFHSLIAFVALSIIIKTVSNYVLCSNQFISRIIIIIEKF